MSGTDREIRVLHVDDEPGFADTTARFLEHETDDIAVETATAVTDALDLLADAEFDCLVSDFDMPGMNGLSFLDHIREAQPELPFILFTGKGSEEVASEAISRGVTDYLQKGAGTEQYEVLANRVRNAVSNYRARREAATTQRRFETLMDRYRFETLTTHEYEAHFILDEDGTCSYASHSTESLLGYGPQELIGEVLFDAVHPDDREVARGVVDAPDSADVTTLRVEHDDGSWVVLEVRSRDRRDDPGIGGIVLIGRDVTERARQRRRAEALAERLDDVDSLVGEMEHALSSAREHLAAAPLDPEADDDVAAVERLQERLADRLSEVATLADRGTLDVELPGAPPT